MTKIIWMSDPHFQNKGTIDGLNPRLRIKAAIDHMHAQHADADFGIISGDLVGDDIVGDYTGIAFHLAKSKIPMHPMMGNNDDRSGLRAHLALPDQAMPDFVQYVINTDDAAFICLDTQKLGSHAGELCSKRSDWLVQILDALREKPAYIFMHHPPMTLNLPAQDEIMLEKADQFLDLISGYSNVKHLFMGHVHRPTCGTVRGIPFATIGAISFQAPAPRPEWHWDGFVPPAEAPHYGVLHISNGDVTLQYTQFCNYETGFEN
ncbi:phosphodiesterase [Loktanella sp. D2R18]|uniref:metallophosphoesterase n=1 Tax=Rhodobacterales TaxID=204455 RepID=UPI000DE8731D|nr:MULTISPECIES: metallophosphoesterase [Rhodobacterales]MDO6591439.1 metallophosphoesterase [Yoonia sp. 1_MG-2023]RBW43496.1 phosphodiesterase [Loktanella sp. D2R18]